MKFLKSLIFVTLVVSVLLSTGCGKKNQLPAEIQAILENQGEWLRLGVYGDPLSLNPIAHIESEHGALVGNFVHASPLRKVEDGTFVPYLFDSYSIFPSSSGTAIILEAVWKSNLKWHDGREFDPKDLEFTFEQIKKPENSSPYAELLDGIDSVNSISRVRTRIVFKKDSRKLLDLLTVGILPSHIIKEQSIETARIEKADVASDSWPLYVEQPIGLGPYRIVAREKGRYLQLQPFADFFAGASRTPVLLCSYFDYQQLVTDFRAKKLEWISLPSVVARQMESMKIENLFYIRYPNPACLTWVFNTRRPILADKRMRKALDLLADRKKVENEAPFTGQILYDSPLNGPPSQEQAPIDRFAAALSLLDELGWKDADADGIREKDGQKLHLSVAFNDDNLFRRAVAEKFADDCRRAGVLLDLKPVSWSDLVSGNLKKGDFDTALLSLKLPAFGNIGAFLHSQAAELNFSGVADTNLDSTLDQLDSMLNAADASKDRDEASLKLAEVNNFLDSERPMAFLFRPLDVGIMHDGSGSAVAAAPVWNDVLNWKVLFGPKDSKL